MAWAERMGRQLGHRGASRRPASAKSAHAHRLIPSHGPAVRSRPNEVWFSSRRADRPGSNSSVAHRVITRASCFRVAASRGGRASPSMRRAHEHKRCASARFLATYEPAMHAAHESDEATVRFGLGFFGQMTSGLGLVSRRVDVARFRATATRGPGRGAQPARRSSRTAAGASACRACRFRKATSRRRRS